MNLLCTKTLVFTGETKPDFIKGKIYKIQREDDEDIMLINENSIEHYFSTSSEYEAYYGNWFDLISEEEAKGRDSNLIVNIDITGIEEVKAIIEELENRLQNLKIRLTI